MTTSSKVVKTSALLLTTAPIRLLTDKMLFQKSKKNHLNATQKLLTTLFSEKLAGLESPLNPAQSIPQVFFQSNRLKNSILDKSMYSKTNQTCVWTRADLLK